MASLVEILKWDVETMEDEIILLRKRNEKLEKETNLKREKFDQLREKADEF